MAQGPAAIVGGERVGDDGRRPSGGALDAVLLRSQDYPQKDG